MRTQTQGWVLGASLGLMLGAALLGARPAYAEALAKPATLTAVNGAVPRFTWSPVAGAGVYRLAVLDAPDGAGHRATLAAVWVSGTAWTYGVDPVLPKVGKLPSTKPQALGVGRKLHVMVRASDAQGASAGPWAATEFTFVPALPTPVAAGPGAPAGPPASAKGTHEADAELDLEGGSEDPKASEGAPVIDLGGAASGAAAGAAGAAAAGNAAAGTVGSAAPDSASTTDTAQANALSPAAATQQDAAALLKDGRNDDAEAAYRALLDKDPHNADDWEGLGDSYRARMMKVEAADCYQQALKWDPSKTQLKDWLDSNVRQ